MKNRAFTLTELIGVVIILGMIALLAFPPLLNMIRGTNDEITKANETLLLTAADQYTDTYKNDFPKNEGNVYCISYGDLIKEELIPSNIPNKDGQTLDYNTKIKVTVNSGKYEYSIDNNCKVKTSLLADILKEQYQEGNTTGLLKDEEGYYYKGTNEEVSNNFVWFAGHLWRVISIDNDNNLTMITQQPITAIQPASEVWNTKEKYESSYVSQWLNEVFLGSMVESDKAKIQDNVFNIGIYNNVSETTITQKVGLLDDKQYPKAGEQNSFLDIKDFFWLANWYDATRIIDVNKDGIMGYPGVTSNEGIRPVIKITNLNFTEGKGTLDNPYREKSTTTNMAQVKVGEYISVPTSGTDCGEDKRCLFRVVSKDNNSIKVILNGLLPNYSAFGSNAVYTSGNIIDTSLIAFANTINENYRYTGSKIFHIGAYGDGANYQDVRNTTYNGNVGLPVVGEMFSGNDIDVKLAGDLTKTFVNVNTIENPLESYYFWMMNAYNTSRVLRIDENGSFSSYNSSIANGSIRPVLFLNNNLNFTSGEGTAENPFIVQ